MSHLLSFLFLFFLLSNQLNAQNVQGTTQNNQSQGTFIGTRIGLNTLNELNLHVDFPTQKKVGLSGSVGFNYGSKVWPGDSGPFCAAIKPRENLAKQGIIGRMGVYFPWESIKGKSQKHHIQLVYRQSVANDVVIDEGCYTGSNSTSIEQYDRYAKELGLMYYLDWVEAGFYIGIGMGGGQYLKEFELIGQFPGRPVAEDETEIGGFAILDIGFRLGGTLY